LRLRCRKGKTGKESSIPWGKGGKSLPQGTEGGESLREGKGGRLKKIKYIKRREVTEKPNNPNLSKGKWAKINRGEKGE